MKRMLLLGLVVIFVHIACGTTAQSTASTTASQTDSAVALVVQEGAQAIETENAQSSAELIAAQSASKFTSTPIPTSLSTRVPTLDVMATATLFALQVQQTQTAEPTPTIFTVVVTSVPTDTPVPTPTSVPTNTSEPVPTTPPTSEPPPPTNVPPTQPPPPPPQNQSAVGQVDILFILFDGAVPRTESDEYAEIKNQSGSPVDMTGWYLNAGDPGQDFHFPSGFILQPDQACRVYTNEVHPDTCGFTYGSRQARWNNDGDCGALYNREGAMVSQKCY